MRFYTALAHGNWAPMLAPATFNQCSLATKVPDNFPFRACQRCERDCIQSMHAFPSISYRGVLLNRNSIARMCGTCQKSTKSVSTCIAEYSPLNGLAQCLAPYEHKVPRDFVAFSVCILSEVTPIYYEYRQQQQETVNSLKQTFANRTASKQVCKCIECTPKCAKEVLWKLRCAQWPQIKCPR